MHIQVSKGIGSGLTELAAFDQALVNAGAANFNLIYLSSVLPPNSQVKISNDALTPSGKWGDRLYVVMAQKRVSQRNQEAWAGIGWIQDPKTRQGLLVEHEGHSEDEVKADIHHSLQALSHNRQMEFDRPQMLIAGTRCADLPACALVVAVFESDTWRNAKLTKLAGLKRSRTKTSFAQFNL